jgi:hypothetical protein
MQRYLYRGDSDPHNDRKLRSVHPLGSGGYLLSNLSNGGSGREIFTTSLVESINRHVGVGWAKTHFLSFSESCDRAKIFAAGPEGHGLIQIYDEPWDGAVITIDTGLFSSRQQVEPGIYRCTYHGRMVVRDKNHLVQVLLIDVVSYLQHHIDTGHTGLNDALEKATRDSEWLILPLDPSDDPPGELTSKLDDGCIADFERYRFEVA